MVRVGVVGAGVAGAAAALEAARRGAQVTLFEGSGRFPTPKSGWPSLLGGTPQEPKSEKVSKDSSVEVLFGSPVSAVDSSGRITAQGRKHEFDAVVVATGSKAVPEPFQGRGKRCVHLLADWDSFVGLAKEVDLHQVVAIYGASLTALEVSERLRARGLRVSLLAPGGAIPSLNEAVRKVLLGAAASAGVRVVDAKPERVVGVERVEAVVAQGEVLPCDAFVELPKAVPSLPEVPERLGHLGGVVVNEAMAFSSPTLFAAGDCAEISVGTTTQPMMFESSAETMGRVAGCNAAGGNVRSRVFGSFFKELFGVGVASSGLGLREALAAGVVAFEVSKTWNDEMACSLVAERSRGAVIGVQLAGRKVNRFAEALPLIVSAGTDLARLAYHETSGSSDISPISETAREALRR